MNANCFHKARFICSKRGELSEVNTAARAHEDAFAKAHADEIARKAKIV